MYQWFLSTLDILVYDIVTSLHLYDYSYVLEHYTYFPLIFSHFIVECAVSEILMNVYKFS